MSYEAVLKELHDAPEYEYPAAADLMAALTAVRDALNSVRANPGFEGKARDQAVLILGKYYKKADGLITAVKAIQTSVQQANDALAAARAAYRRLDDVSVSLSPVLRGLIEGAGVVSGGVIGELEAEAVTRVLAAHREAEAEKAYNEFSNALKTASVRGAANGHYSSGDVPSDDDLAGEIAAERAAAGGGAAGSGYSAGAGTGSGEGPGAVAVSGVVAGGAMAGGSGSYGDAQIVTNGTIGVGIGTDGAHDGVSGWTTGDVGGTDGWSAAGLVPDGPVADGLSTFTHGGGGAGRGLLSGAGVSGGSGSSGGTGLSGAWGAGIGSTGVLGAGAQFAASAYGAAAEPASGSGHGLGSTAGSRNTGADAGAGERSGSGLPGSGRGLAGSMRPAGSAPAGDTAGQGAVGERATPIGAGGTTGAGAKDLAKRRGRGLAGPIAPKLDDEPEPFQRVPGYGPGTRDNTKKPPQ